MENWPPALTESQVKELTQLSCDYCHCNGLAMRSRDNPTLCHHAPIALYPSPFPRREFERANQIQPAWNELVHRMSIDKQFLFQTFEKLAQVDTFQARLYEIWKLVADKPHPISVGIHRSDYMLHQESDGGTLAIQQVELNTIAASFGSLSSLCGNMHRFVASRTQYYNHQDDTTMDIHARDLPPNKSLQSLAAALAKAHELYCQEYNVKSAYVVIIVQSAERNIFDQRAIELELFGTHGVKMLRKTLRQMYDEGTSKDGRLVVDGVEVAVVYYRAGYGPSDYHGEEEWQARSLVEQSLAVKCPSVAYQLVGAKKCQQLLANAGVVERYVANAQDANLLRSCFTGIYSLDADDDGDRNARMASGDADVDKYVLKPQREGGGNNFYGADVATHLNKISRQERSAYILMQRIRPPSYQNTLVKQQQVATCDVICELGVYGVYVRRGDKVLVNEAGGHLLRTKSSTTNEGGVATGYSVIDSPLLY